MPVTHRPSPLPRLPARSRRRHSGGAVLASVARALPALIAALVAGYAPPAAAADPASETPTAIAGAPVARSEPASQPRSAMAFTAERPAPPTFSEDVAPILFAHCTGCHRPAAIGAAVPLLSYDGLRPFVQQIGRQVAERRMPPWPADPKHSLKFSNDARLSQRDVDTVVAWVDAGAPRGNDADLPPPPPAARGWSHPAGTPPDAVLTLPEIAVAGSGEIPYVQQRIKVPMADDRWIVAMQVRPGNDALVHHMGITEVQLASDMTPRQLDDFAAVARQLGMGEDALDTSRPAVAGPIRADTFDMLGVYTPGTTFEMYPPGSAKLLKGGSNYYVNFNIHYTTVGSPQKDRSQLALWFQPRPPAHQLFRAPAAVDSIVANGRELLTDDPGTKAEGTPVAIPPIAANDAHYELVGMTAYADPVIIYQLQPHAHMRARSFRYDVVYPDGRERTVLTVPRYDFHWQLAYDLETPLELPAGSKLVVTARYDNSTGNEHLRGLGNGDLGRNCGPDKIAYFRRENQSWHEMFSPLIQYSLGDTHGPRAPLPIVSAVGCLVHDGEGWTLTRAGPPAASATQATSAAALARSAAMPPGDASYRLLGAEPFRASSAASYRAAVKGVLIADREGDRINVTSLHKLRGACPPPGAAATAADPAPRPAIVTRPSRSPG